MEQERSFHSVLRFPADPAFPIRRAGPSIALGEDNVKDHD
jgi:hypothetical protein